MLFIFPVFFLSKPIKKGATLNFLVTNVTLPTFSIAFGPGNSQEFLDEIEPQLRSRITFLGKLSDEEKADFMSSVGAYIGPNTGGESFGIILTEALAGGAAVIASDIPAFQALLKDGRYGRLFKSEDSTDLAKVVIDLFREDMVRADLQRIGREYAQSFDWDVVGNEIFEVYEMAIVGGDKIRLGSESRPWNKIWNRDKGTDV